MITLLHRMKVASNARFANVEPSIQLPNYLPLEVVLTVYRRLNDEYKKEVEKLLV